MNTPFNMPDEYTQGLVKAGQNLMQALVAGSTAQLGDAASAGTTPLVQLQSDYLKQQFTLWARMMSGGLTGEPVVAAERGDRRFHGSEWQENPTYSLLKQGYLLNSRFLTDLVEAAEIDESTRHRLRFYMRQFVDAMSPANFAATNPDVLKLAMESGGKSLRTGLENLQADLRKGGLSITDESAFEIGKNVAVSEGSVIFENDLFQLIQYAPLTDTVASRPLVIVPPCINKFYILDLQPENSFVRFCAEQGHSVFLVSWRNPDASGGHLTWDDYVERGAIAALEVAREVSGADQVNALGWCVGGTILSTALAVLAARGDTSVASLTLLTTMLDFREPGDLGVFIDEQNVLAREKTIGNGGIYPGSELGFVFQTLRANDLIWPNVINNYLKGKSPEAFDLLFWNADSTNLPGPMYAWYLRNMYLENNLAVAGKLSVCGQVLDVGRIKVPSYVLATREDHIVPWRSAYLTTQLLGGPSQFVLGASGHIAGVINPVSKNKRSYWVGGRQGDDPQAWLDSASETPGSWWSHWNTWLTPFRGDSVAAPRKPGSRKYKVIEPAPGRYVQVRAGDAK
mgnify:CR=1 FL=1